MVESKNKLLSNTYVHSMNVFHFKILCLYLDTNINLDIQIYALFIQKMIDPGPDLVHLRLRDGMAQRLISFSGTR